MALPKKVVWDSNSINSAGPKVARSGMTGMVTPHLIYMIKVGSVLLHRDRIRTNLPWFVVRQYNVPTGCPH